MAVVFVSHSSRNDAAANALETWLRGNGFGDIFIDHEAIAGGEKWREALRASAGACRVILCLVTEQWLASAECFAEFIAASYMGKRIIPLFLLPSTAELGEDSKARLAKVCAEDQGIKLESCLRADGALDLSLDRAGESRLREGLRAAGAISEVGLDPEAFTIDRKLRPSPFPGLASFHDDDADAALFYGRSREIAATLEELRQMRVQRDLRPFVILGASGAGKSSLLMAGILPRLRREAPAWLPLRAFRPGAHPLLNFADAIARTLAGFGKHVAEGSIRDRLYAAASMAERKDGELTTAGRAALQAALDSEARGLRQAAGAAAVTILISVDQAEELARSGGDSGEFLADYLRVASTIAEGNYQLAFTTRTDSFTEMQKHRVFRGLEARGYDLRPLPVFRFDTVIEEPARRYGVSVEPALVDALVEDAPQADALPLLAFVLQRLWQQYASSKNLTKAQYERFGGLTGLIEDAAERSMRGIELEHDAPLPSAPPPKQLLDLAASTFVPALAQVNEQGGTIRRVAEWKSFSSEQQELLQRFDRWRLVVRRGKEEGGTVEVAHEALFREWPRLKGWLEPERAHLETLQSLQTDAANWDRHGRDPLFLNHRGKRLAAVDLLLAREDYRSRLGPVELEYLAACQAAEREARKRARRAQMIVAALLLLLLAGLAAWWQGPWLNEQAYWLAHVHALSASLERELKPGDSPFKECTGCPEMVVMPAGTFMMGSPERMGDKREFPAHEVAIAAPFAVGKYEVTFDEWQTCVDHGDCPEISTSGWGKGRQPVINLSFSDAQHYLAWLSRITGRTYRLLSEAEWEYAARAYKPTLYFFGNDEGPLGQYAWFAANSGKQTHPVGEKRANPFGLHDVYGNVSEWVEDCSHDDYRGAPSDGSAWVDENCTARVVRGGYWLDRASALRSASRDWAPFDKREDYIGFRIARPLRR